MPGRTRPFGTGLASPTIDPPPVTPADPRTVRIVRTVNRPGRSDEPPKSWRSVPECEFDTVVSWRDASYDIAQDDAQDAADAAAGKYMGDIEDRWVAAEHLHYESNLRRDGYGVSTATGHEPRWAWHERLYRGDGWTDEEWTHLLHSRCAAGWIGGMPQRAARR